MQAFCFINHPIKMLEQWIKAAHRTHVREAFAQEKQ
jgi:hypothetical protein